MIPVLKQYLRGKQFPMEAFTAGSNSERKIYSRTHRRRKRGGGQGGGGGGGAGPPNNLRGGANIPFGLPIIHPHFPSISM